MKGISWNLMEEEIRISWNLMKEEIGGGDGLGKGLLFFFQSLVVVFDF